jgi:choline dehydrogenase-like flavoprotein
MSPKWALSESQRRTLRAAVARIVPADEHVGALELGACEFIEAFLAGIDQLHASPSGNGFLPLSEREQAAWQQRVGRARALYVQGLARLERVSRELGDGELALQPAVVQDAVLARVAEECGAVGGGNPPANQPVESDRLPFFQTLVAHTRQGCYCDPAYGGNRDRRGWKAIGFDGPKRMSDVASGHYSTTRYLAEPVAAYDGAVASPHPRPMSRSIAHRRRRVDVCIIGAGAGGGTAAKVLSEAGCETVVLERGPWIAESEFSPDELANYNRHLLWPDPLLHPRTYREGAEDAVVQPFCPTPSLVGGATVHWSAWMPRPLESDFRLRSLHGDITGASVVDWPVGYRDLEPYFERIERLLGVAGIRGANPHEVPRREEFPQPPLPRSRYGARVAQACSALGLSSFPMPQAIASRPYGARPASTHHGFAQQYGDPTGARAWALNTVLADALATGRVEVRADSLVRELLLDDRGRCDKVIYEDADGREHCQESEAVVLACGAMESARLLLLSGGNRFPDGLANGSGQLGRNLTLHEYTYAIGLFDPDQEPIYGWAGSYEGGCCFDYYESDERRDHLLGCMLSCTGLGHPINFTYPGRPLWGVDANRADRDYFNHSMKVGVLVHDLPQESNRVELDPEVRDAWDMSVLRVTHRAHPNDLALGNWTVARAAEILEAAGAGQVIPVPIERISGNCAHQHGTARMGADAGAAVLDPWCQAHEVPGLWVLDGSGFPTATGVNPTLTIMANAWRCADQMLATRARRAA